MPRYDAVILTCQQLLAADPSDWYNAQVQREDGLLFTALQQRGLNVARLDWADPDVDWGNTGCAVFRTVWDYFHRYTEFAPWLQRVARQTQLFNPAATLNWNIDKHYLLDLERAGVAVVPTAVFAAGSGVDLAAQMQVQGWDEVVFKPAISGAARHTYRVQRDNAAAHQAIWQGCLNDEAMLLQPFMPQIVLQGELSLMIIDGRYTHAIRKTAKAGDFRVQDDHGGAVHTYQASAEEIAFAENAVARCGHEALYARVDMIRDPVGQLRIMELELIEPELFFRFHEPAAEALAEAIVHRLR